MKAAEAPSSRRDETLYKISRCRDFMKHAGIEAIRFRGVDWFSWITSGASSVVIMTTEAGVAEVLISQEDAVVLTDHIEEARLAAEELKHLEGALDLRAFSWADSQAKDLWIEKILGSSARIASDRPVQNFQKKEEPLPERLELEKRRLLPTELERYREVGRLSAEAMTAALTLARPEMTEFELAGLGARELLKRGVDPTLTLVAGESRVSIHRHPTPSHAALGAYAMMVFCGRRYGLYANLTRFVFFEKAQAEHLEKFHKLSLVEARALKMSLEKRALGDIYHGIAQAYDEVGLVGEIHKHHQGGPCGYLSRDFIARPDSTVMIENHHAVAWNPSTAAAKVEDTIYVGDDGLEVLSFDPQWPSSEIAGLKRPLPLQLDVRPTQQQNLKLAREREAPHV